MDERFGRVSNNEISIDKAFQKSSTLRKIFNCETERIWQKKSLLTRKLSIFYSSKPEYYESTKSIRKNCNFNIRKISIEDGQNTGEPGQQQFETGHVQLAQHLQPAGNPVEGTFRHPLPPGIGRPRMPIPGIQQNSHIRTTLGKNYTATLTSQYLWAFVRVTQFFDPINHDQCI